MKEFRNIEQVISDLEETRTAMLFSGTDAEERMQADIDSTMFACHFYLQAMALIEQAEHTLQLAARFQARELAGNF